MSELNLSLKKLLLYTNTHTHFLYTHTHIMKLCNYKIRTKYFNYFSACTILHYAKSVNVQNY